jgi:hypothetical protein
MPQGDKSVKAAAVMPESLKEQLRKYAESKRWTMSQAIVYFVEKGLEEESSSPPSKRKT